MSLATPGLHHVTAIAGDSTRNAAFSVETLDLRFVERTVDHDDAHTDHLYCGDARRRPGTTVTLFAWTDEGRVGRFGAGQARETADLIDPDSVEYWADRLADHDVDVDEPAAYRERLRERGLDVPEVIDRTYFRAVCAREPGDVRFEIATAGQGIDADEDIADPGSRLALPGRLGDERAAIEAATPAFDPPAPTSAAGR
jgi:glyoxalase family protein